MDFPIRGGCGPIGRGSRWVLRMRIWMCCITLSLVNYHAFDRSVFLIINVLGFSCFLVTGMDSLWRLVGQSYPLEAKHWIRGSGCLRDFLSLVSSFVTTRTKTYCSLQANSIAIVVQICQGWWSSSPVNEWLVAGHSSEDDDDYSVLSNGRSQCSNLVIFTWN